MSAFSPLGTDLFGDPISPAKQSPVAQRFLVSPFSVLSAREGDWQERKRCWVGMGIQSELGREAAAFGDCSQWQTRTVQGKNCTPGANSCTLGTSELEEGGQCVTSIFDPVLCELVYRWFSREGAQIIDPFAGGSVRGIVASYLKQHYWGSELRSEQVEANRTQAAQLCNTHVPVYVQGDSMDTLADAPEADLLFSCPPYGDLEVYSDDPADLSNMEWHTFVAAYKRIIMRACKKLRPDRFACFVVGDFRDSRGFYRDFVSTTINAFTEQGLSLYNEAILVTAVGSAAMRVTRQFDAGRKLCKTHQNVLVFCKGDWRKASAFLNEKKSPQEPQERNEGQF